ncbi:MAG: DUF1580 domain-containing protein [Phycisphaerae bacterium]|jgi:hypothetical protein
MIDVERERVMTLAEAAKLRWLPRRRAGKRPHVATLLRWATAGCRGIVLETVFCGATRCTSSEAIARFFQRLTAARAGGEQARNVPTPRQREREIARAERELAAAGVLLEDAT